jgi:hypothetical protein
MTKRVATGLMAGRSWLCDIVIPCALQHDVMQCRHGIHREIAIKIGRTLATIPDQHRIIEDAAARPR